MKAFLLGTFDGVHLGHQALIARARSLVGPKGEVQLLTFNNHPATYLRPENAPKVLCSLEHKIELLKEAGADEVITVDFSAPFANQSVEEFVRDWKERLDFSYFVVGHDARLGRDRTGTPGKIRELGNLYHFGAEEVAGVLMEEKLISSTRCRQAVSQGDFTLLQKLLGRPYSIKGPVVAGNGEGRKLGAATANLEIEGFALPPFGVYASTAKLESGGTFPAIANLGVAPTFGGNNPRLEVHLIGFERTLYGEKLEWIPQRFLRPEKTFSSPEELQQQIALDLKAVMSPTGTKSRQTMGRKDQS